jgi:mono/diheme cytochrome c family protein
MMTQSMKWIGMLATLVIVIMIPYYVWAEPYQQETLRDEYYTKAVLTTSDLYAENCAVCHGAAGEGIGENPALNSETLRLMSNTDLSRVIARGRDNTLMAAWAVEEGGIFTNAQIQDFVSFVQQVNWDYVEVRVAELGLTPPQVIEMEVSAEMLASLSELQNGEALQDGLQVYAGNCAACHGANGSGTIIAPAIDSPDLRATSRDEIVDLISYGVAGTLMAGWEKILSPEELTAAVDLIYRWPELVQADIEFPKVEVMSVPASADLIAAGDQLFNIACKSCHGVDGYGSPMAPALNNQIFLTQTPDAAIYQIIAGGAPNTLMPAWGNRLTDYDIQSLVAFLRSLENTAPVIVPPILKP